MEKIYTVDMSRVYTNSEYVTISSVVGAALGALKAAYSIAYKEAVEQGDMLPEDQRQTLLSLSNLFVEAEALQNKLTDTMEQAN